MNAIRLKLIQSGVVKASPCRQTGSEALGTRAQPEVKVVRAVRGNDVTKCKVRKAVAILKGACHV